MPWTALERSTRDASLPYTDAPRLAYTEVDAKDRTLAFWCLFAGVAVLLLSLPAAHVPGGAVAVFLSTATALATFAQLLTAFLLLNQYRGSQSPPLAVLALGYGGTAALGIEALVGLNASSPAALETSSAGTPWLYLLTQAYFVTYVILFVVWERWCRRYPTVASGSGLPALTGLAVLVCGGALIALSRNGESAFFAGAAALALWKAAFGPALLILQIVAFLLLMFGTRLRRTVHLWLSVALAASFAATLLANASAGMGFSAAAYAGRVEWVMASSVFLVVLLSSVYRILLSLTSSNETLYEQAISDELTGLFNRRGFNRRIEEELRRAARKGENLALLLIDIDNFKRYNDAFGHPAGDAALGAVARVIRNQLRRAADSGCRIGGEEFAVLLPETDDAGAIAIAERIRFGVERLGIMQGQGAHHRVLTVSVGVASTSRYVGSDALALTRHADRALYDVKNAGRNGVHFQGASGTPAGESSLAI